MDSIALTFSALAACFGVVAFVTFQRLRLVVLALRSLGDCVRDLNERALELEQAARIAAATNVARLDETRGKVQI